MGDRRAERQRTRQRGLLEEVMGQVEARGGAALEDPGPTRTGLVARGPSAAEALFFHDHAAFLEGVAEVLAAQGLAEALLSMARHQQDDRDHWLRRLALLEAEPRLRNRRVFLDQDYLALLEAHFRRWGAAGPAGERAAAFEATLVLQAYRQAERLWVQGQGRPVLPVLVQEGLALLWPALYQHLRRGK